MRIFADSAAEIDEQLFGIRQMRIVRIVAGVNKYFSEKDRTYQALVALGYSVGEQRYCAVADDRHKLIIERVPLHIRFECRDIMKQSTLHISDASVLCYLIFILPLNLFR